MKKKKSSEKKQAKIEKQKTQSSNEQEKEQDIDIDLNNIDINSMLDDDNSRSSSMQIGDILPNVDKLNEATGMNDLDTAKELIQYAFANDTEKPIILQKLLSDGDARIKEISTINALQSQLNITKLSSLEKVILDDIIKSVENMAYMSIEDKLSILATVTVAKEKAQKQVFEYIKLSYDFNSMPTIYQQLVSKLMIMPDDKVHRFTSIPALMELPDELWDRIMEIVNLWNK